MKAVMLAGGEGSRLRPISCNRPKPMVRLFDKPVLEHSLLLLRRHDFCDITATLQFMPHCITDYFGDGSAWGVNLRYAVEEKALGTAGGVAAAMRGCQDDCLLVISGDAVCDFDLSAALAYHRAKQADVTLLLKRQDELLDYGLVMLQPDGRVDRFIEKPSWRQVFSDLVNTGIYILDPRVLSHIPSDTVFDFARDLFPLLMRQGSRLFGYEAAGYWCDIGDPQSYLRCHFDALNGQVPLFAANVQSHVPDGVVVTPPCYIGTDVLLQPGCRIGPHAVLCSGSSVASGAIVEQALVDGAHLAAGVQAVGAIVCRGATIKPGAVLSEGSVVGENSVVGSHAVLHEHSRLWPDKEVPDGDHVCGSIATGCVRRELTFDGEGRMQSRSHADLSPDFCLRLGNALAQAVQGKLGIAHTGGEQARVIAELLSACCNAAGLSTVAHDAPTAAVSAAVGQQQDWALTLFIRQNGAKTALQLFDRNGLPIGRELERKIEGAARRGDTTAADPDRIGTAESLRGSASVYLSLAAQGQATLPLSVSGHPVSATLLRHALEATGCRVTRNADALPMLGIDDDGFQLVATDEHGLDLPADRLLALGCWLAWHNGVPAVAVPYDAPACLDSWASQLSAILLRVDRDGPEASALLARQLFMRDACARACLLADGLTRLGLTLNELNRRVPAFSTTSIEVPLQIDRGAVMRALAEQSSQSEQGQGLRLRVGTGWVTVAPLTARSALRIIAEGEDMETAAELCDVIKKRVQKLDRKK